MKRILPYLCILTAALPAAARAQAGVVASAADGTPVVHLTASDGKVTAPVEIEIVAAESPAPGVRRVRIVARPTVEAPSLVIEVEGEAGLSLSGGDATWTAPARAGEEVVREVDLAVSGAGEQRVVVTATVKDAAGEEQTAYEVFAFNRAVTSAFARMRSAPTDPGGRVIVEVPAATP